MRMIANNMPKWSLKEKISNRGDEVIVIYFDEIKVIMTMVSISLLFLLVYLIVANGASTCM